MLDQARQKNSRRLRKCQSHSCMVRHIILDHVLKYVDPRAHLVEGELRYSIYMKEGQERKPSWKRRVLKNTDIHRIYMELYA